MAIEPSGAARPALRLETGSPVRAVSDRLRRRRGRSELDWVSARRHARRMASRRPRVSRASVTRAGVLIARHPRGSRCGISGGRSGSRDGRSSACERTIGDRQGRDLRLRDGAVMLAPRALPKPPPLLLRRRSWHIGISAYEAVDPLSQVGTPSPTQREHNGLTSTAYMCQIASALRADGDLAVGSRCRSAVYGVAKVKAVLWRGAGLVRDGRVHLELH